MGNQAFAEPPFRLRQESTRRVVPTKRPLVASPLEAWPTGQGDYFLAGRDTWPIKDRIHAAGGKWDSQTRRWYVTKAQALALGATVLVRVLRAPACCERHIEAPLRGVAALATQAELLAERMVAKFCPLCDSHIHEPVAIRDVVDAGDLDELPSAPVKPPWED